MQANNVVSINSFSINRTFKTSNFQVCISKERRRFKGEFRTVFEARIHLRAGRSTERKTFFNMKPLCSGISLLSPKLAVREASKTYRKLHSIIKKVNIRESRQED
jgi:hypothetical protein